MQQEHWIDRQLGGINLEPVHGREKVIIRNDDDVSRTTPEIQVRIRCYNWDVSNSVPYFCGLKETISMLFRVVLGYDYKSVYVIAITECVVNIQMVLNSKHYAIKQML